MLRTRSAAAPGVLLRSARRCNSRAGHVRLPLRQRRFNASSNNANDSKIPPPSPDPNKAPISIPGPSWLSTPLKPLTYPLGLYSRAQKKRPYVTQFISSLVIYFLGDLSSQFIQRPTATSSSTSSETRPNGLAGKDVPTTTTTSFLQHYDPMRSIRALCIGGLSSIPSYHWFMYLSSLFPRYTHLPRLALQVAINQVVFAPLFNTYFFGMQSLLASVQSASAAEEQAAAGGRLRAAYVRVRDTLPVSWWNSCKFWPLVTAFSFTFVQPQSRSVFAGVVAVGWQTYLGLLNTRAVQAERERWVKMGGE